MKWKRVITIDGETYIWLSTLGRYVPQKEWEKRCKELGIQRF